MGQGAASKDLDLVVEGPGPWPALALAEAIRSRVLPQGFLLQELHQHGAYGTARLLLQAPQGELICDLTSARREHYPFPGAHPLVAPASLREDLNRRDFTLNAMAWPLQQGLLWSPQALVDPLGGQADLAAALSKRLGSSSRLRACSRRSWAARYAARLGLELAPESATQADEALSHWPWPPGRRPWGRGCAWSWI